MTPGRSKSRLRIAIATRIYLPEPSAASFRLSALATALADAGHEVVVLTVVPPRPMRADNEPGRPRYAIRRFPVLRDRSGYVRGYLQYLSFDVPLFFRLLLSRRYDMIVAEPPPTTGVSVRLAAALRRTPYAYYAADIWSDAAQQTAAPKWMVRAVRSLERFAMRGAQLVLSVSDGVTNRLAEPTMGIRAETIGNGIDVAAFGEATFPDEVPTHHQEFVYAGTASEWHGAELFLEAMPAVLRRQPHARLSYIGGGSERPALEARAKELGIEASVSFESVRPPAEIAHDLRTASAAVASVRPGSGYDFAFPTKLYSAAACGAPLIYAGIGPGVEFVNTVVDGSAIGQAVGANSSEVAEAMIAAAQQPFDARRRRVVANWAAVQVSLDAIASRAAQALEKAVLRGVK